MSGSLIEKLSDEEDEIFIGPITLKEVRKRLNLGQNRQTIATVAHCDEDQDKSLRIIETSSEPDISVAQSLYENSGSNNSSLGLYTKQNIKCAEDSFLMVEKMVEGMDKTSELIDYIIKEKALNETKYYKNKSSNITKTEKVETNTKKKDPKSLQSSSNLNVHQSLLKGVSQTPLKVTQSCHTPFKADLRNQEFSKFSTPSTEHRWESVLKTPLPSYKIMQNLSSKTQNKTNRYQYVASPVASYIKSTPKVPLMTNVRPKKPLPSTSSIRRHIHTEEKQKPCDKENFNLPSLAYKSAKKTNIVSISDEGKFPHSQWSQKLASSQTKPVVIKHGQREMNFTAKRFVAQQEDSFADLTVRQADVSVCTQRSALKRP